MKNKILSITTALCCFAMTVNLQGAWNPKDLRGSLVISKITKADSLPPYEVGQCSTVYLYENQGKIPNESQYQKPYSLYYSSPPLANIKSLFKDNKLTIRPAQFEKCTVQDTEPYFTIELPPGESNMIKLKKIESGGTYVTNFDLNKLKNFLINKTSYLEGKSFYSQKTSNPWKTFSKKIPEEEFGYFYIQYDKSKNPYLIFIEVSIDLAIDYIPDAVCEKNNYKFCGFGYIPTVNVRHIKLQPKILDLLKYSSAAQFISSPKTIATGKDYQIPLETLIDEDILKQFVE